MAPLPTFVGGKRPGENPFVPAAEKEAEAAHWPYVCVCACANVSLLVGRSDVVGREVGNVSFSNKIKYFEKRIWRWSFMLSPSLSPFSVC